MDSTKRILLVDNHPIVSCGLNNLISVHYQDCIISEVRTIKDMFAALAADAYTHMVLGLNLSDGNSIDVLPELTNKYPQLRILIYSMAPEEVYARKLLQMGTSGFLSKSATEKELVRGLGIFLHGGIYISSAMELRELGKKEDYNAFYNLSMRELRVLDLLLKGYKTKAMAAEFDVKPQTIAKHKSRIFEKLGTENLFDIQKLADLYHVGFP